MTIIYKLLQAITGKPKEYFFFTLSSRDKKKIVLKALEESNKMQIAVLDKYAQKFPHDVQKFYHE